MKKLLLFLIVILFYSLSVRAQSCDAGGCSNFTNQYPSSTFSTTSASWTTVSAYMNAGNWTLFNVTQGNTYEWSYCTDFGGSQSWDAELTLYNNSTSAVLCYQNNCGLTSCPNAPYLSWTATFTGTVKLLTTEASCQSNTGSPYSTLVWRQSNGGASTLILGVDVSHYDSDSPYSAINWQQVKGAGYVFAFAKATQGVSYTDPTFITNMTNGLSAGEVMGTYHFATPITNGAVAEAQHFLSVASPYIGQGFLPPVLDLEDPSSGGTLSGSFTSAALTTWVQQWMTEVQTQTGVAPIIYTNGNYASYLNSSINIYKLWVADPDGSPITPPANIGVWTNWTFKQYDWYSAVSGIGNPNVDMNVFNGDSTAFNNLIGINTSVVSEKSSVNNFVIYPNPAIDNITVENTSLIEGENEMVFIFNLQGQLLLQQTMLQTKVNIDISSLTGGMYLVEVKSEKGVLMKKFVKE